MCGYFLYGVPTQGADTRFINAPVSVAGQAFVLVLLHLDPGCLAVRAGAAGMEPVAVGVERALNLFITNGDSVTTRELSERIVPGVALHFNEFDVFRVGGVVKEGVRKFM